MKQRCSVARAVLLYLATVAKTFIATSCTHTMLKLHCLNVSLWSARHPRHPRTGRLPLLGILIPVLGIQKPPRLGHRLPSPSPLLPPARRPALLARHPLLPHPQCHPHPLPPPPLPPLPHPRPPALRHPLLYPRFPHHPRPPEVA